jgi:hypothetical protein
MTDPPQSIFQHTRCKRNGINPLPLTFQWLRQLVCWSKVAQPGQEAARRQVKTGEEGQTTGARGQGTGSNASAKRQGNGRLTAIFMAYAAYAGMVRREEGQTGADLLDLCPLHDKLIVCVGSEQMDPLPVSIGSNATMPIERNASIVAARA